MHAVTTYLWIRGGRQADRRAHFESLNLPVELIAPVNAHRQLRGPFTAAGSIVRDLVPRVVPADGEIVRRHDIEVLSVAPELSSMVPGSRETLTSMAIPKERTRFYAPLRTRRIANGLVELVEASLPIDTPRSLILEHVDQAETTDLEFIAALLRRIDPARLVVVVCSASDDLQSGELGAGLELSAVRHEVAATRFDGPGAESDPTGLAWRYVATDGTSDEPELTRAYDVLDDGERARLHDRRADELERLDEQSLRLGTIPFHRERGSDPGGQAVRALRSAQDYCVCMGYYTAVVDYGQRALGLIDAGDQPDLWWGVIGALGLALALLGRTKEAEALYDQARLLSVSPDIHMAAAYSTAMLYTRHKDPADRDDRVAKRWLNSAIAAASLLADRSIGPSRAHSMKTVWLWWR